jgi:hypothetical protein
MSTVEHYVQAKVGDDLALRRRVIADMERAGISITADTTETYKKMIDQLLSKIKAKRTPVEQRKPVPYGSVIGEHDKKILDGVDPITNDKLYKVALVGKRVGMFNPKNNACWPLPTTSESGSI